MKPYTQPADPQKYMDHVIGGHIKCVDGVWYWTEWHVAYAQQGVDTSDNFVTREEADAKFAARLADLRKAWGHRGARFTETEEEAPNGKRIRFRSVLKNGKPGKLTGLLYMNQIKR